MAALALVFPSLPMVLVLLKLSLLPMVILTSNKSLLPLLAMSLTTLVKARILLAEDSLEELKMPASSTKASRLIEPVSFKTVSDLRDASSATTITITTATLTDPHTGTALRDTATGTHLPATTTVTGILPTVLNSATGSQSSAPLNSQLRSKPSVT